MTPAEARSILEEAFSPLPVAAFLDAMGRTLLEVKGGPTHPRCQLLGADPRHTLLSAFRTHASQLGCHSVAPTQPPPAVGPVGDPSAFLRLIQRFHERDYTVTIGDVVALSPPLQRFTRALEALLHQPVSASVFWSKAGAKARVHYDNRENIVVQLSGRKRWFISTDPPTLSNNWKHVGEGPLSLERHKVVDASPGDLLFVPRGTPHTVESTTESLHLAILFTPLTLRDAVIAAIDHLSDLDRTFRETLLTSVDDPALPTLPNKVTEGVARLLVHCRSAEFVASAMGLRSARMIDDLPPLPKPAAPVPLTLQSRVTHAPLAIAHLVHLGSLLDFSHPGARIGIHAGAEPALRYILDNTSFQVSEIPGLSDDVRLALVNRLLSSGFLLSEPYEAGTGDQSLRLQ
jgi:mannose-6-phosphate isomerase-like protein (cupin superfamily)